MDIICCICAGLLIICCIIEAIGLAPAAGGGRESIVEGPVCIVGREAAAGTEAGDEAVGAPHGLGKASWFGLPSV